jgi:hypothetical protein
VQRVPPWLVCQSAKPGEDVVSEIVFVREEDVRRVEIRRGPAKKGAIGFAVKPTDEDTA